MPQPILDGIVFVENKSLELMKRLRLPRMWAKIRQSSPKQLFLGGAYALSLAITTFIVWLVIATPGTGPLAQTSRILLIIAVANLGLLILLAYFVVMSVINIARQREGDAGSRLHLRFVALFSAAAVVPALIVASSVGFLFSGIDSWFSERVRASVENGASIAKTYVESEHASGADAFGYVQSALESDSAQALFPDRLAYAVALKNTLSVRGQFSAIYVIDHTGQVLARAENDDAPPYAAPPRDFIDDVEANGAKGVLVPGPDSMRFLAPLTGYDRAFLYGVKLLPTGVAGRLQSADTSIQDYRETANNQKTAQSIFALAFFETVLLVLIGAIWLAMSAAESIAVPVARLVQAAHKVASGDLNARVNTAQQTEDIAVLSRAFNRMTSDLQSQQLALKSAGEEAESRRRFIETVLSEISAGIVGLDVLEHVSAINRHAANFLGVSTEDALGQKIRELAPEITELLDKVSVQKVEEQEVDLIRKGETRRLRVRVSGLETGGAVLTFDDITRLVTAQRNAAWKDVARRIAHEIKNPLTPIQLSAERIRKKYRGQINADIETFDRCTDTIIRQVGDIGRMVDEFAAFARMPAPTFSEEDIAELVRACVFAQRVARPDIKIEVVEPLLSNTIVCDGRMLSQALGNVLKNAGEAILSAHLKNKTDPQGGAIRIEMVADGTFLMIMVEDDGIGLPDKDRDRLTEPYVTTREKGTGLGLAIVKRILEDHNGEFYLSDGLYLKGARAVLRLPLHPAGSPANVGQKPDTPIIAAQNLGKI